MFFNTLDTIIYHGLFDLKTAITMDFNTYLNLQLHLNRFVQNLLSSKTVNSNNTAIL